MRELLFRHLTSQDRKRKDLFISETTVRDGVRTITKRHSIYIVEGSSHFSTLKDLIDWQARAKEDVNKRHVFIFKTHNTKAQKDSFICDVVGKFFAVVKQDVYSVAFKHSFEIDFVNAK